MNHSKYENPFRPGAGHIPPYLAGRTYEKNEVRKALDQKIVTDNIILTGLRGVGKTVLLEELKPIAVEKNWLWVGNDLSETSSISEHNLSIRIITDIAVTVSALLVSETKTPGIGFGKAENIVREPLDYKALKKIYDDAPGLVSDKLKSTLEYIWFAIPPGKVSGIVFAYDEAQNLADHAKAKEYPLSLLLEVFQSLQHKNIPFLLLLTGLPTLFPNLVEARTYAERMFHVLFLKQLNEEDAEKAITVPTENYPLKFSDTSVKGIINLSGGYPYFIQFICKEVYNIWIAKMESGEVPTATMDDIIRKLDTDFFQGRWAKATDRQRELLVIIPSLSNCDGEFTVQEIVAQSQKSRKPFSASHINQMLSSLSQAGLIYKNRYGKYSLAVPLLSRFIKRQIKEFKASEET
jgi:hypothetical protein